MLKIRLTRTGKTNQESFRIVVAEQKNAVKGKYLELVGYYLHTKNPKVLNVKKDRIEYWISKGAKPSSTLAALLKKEGHKDMEKYIDVRPTRKKKKGAGKDATVAPVATIAK